jgi:hypothetical protein
MCQQTIALASRGRGVWLKRNALERWFIAGTLRLHRGFIALDAVPQ